MNFPSDATDGDGRTLTMAGVNSMLLTPLNKYAHPSPDETIDVGYDDSGETNEYHHISGLSSSSSSLSASPLLVLVLSSMPRSGSTFLSDLLTNVVDSILFFEPLWKTEKNKQCMSNLTCVNKQLFDIFSCDFDEQFESWLKGYGLFFQYFNDEARECIKHKNKTLKKTCVNRMELHKLCRSAPIRIVKVIRARLSWIETFLQDPLLNFKVIHLVRDPRGSLNSIRKFGWVKDPPIRCGDLENDLITYDNFHKRFPSRVFQLNYELLCLYPTETTKNLFRFITGNASLTQKIKNFVDKHMTENISGSMTTFRESKKHYDEWRYQISQIQLESIENEAACLNSIKRLNFGVFGSIEKCRNKSISLLLENDIKYDHTSS